MSFLAPLYALGMLVVALPVLFHLLQRRPRRQTEFSSLMFLDHSPPRITRRSRLSNLLLLLLRITAIALLSVAFARPFLRDIQMMSAATPARRVVILLDRSASMRQEGVWQQAQDAVRDVLGELAPQDNVSLLSFDHQLHTVVATNPMHRDASYAKTVIQQAAEALEPGWGATDLGGALAATADLLNSESPDEIGNASIVLISDLQSGANLDALQSAEWPENVHVDIRETNADPDNAYAQLLPDADDSKSTLRVRVTNSEHAKTGRLELDWRFPHEGDAIQKAKSLQVPPGRSRVVSLSHPERSAILTLSGDAQVFDNEQYLAVRPPIEYSMTFVGDNHDLPNSLYFFLKRAELGSTSCPVSLITTSAGEPPPELEPSRTPFIVHGGIPTEDWATALHRYLTQGGRALIVLDPHDKASPDAPIDAPTLAKLLDLKSLRFEPVKPDDFAIWTSVDYESELFRPFAEPSFNDFTKIRFWRYYRPVAEHEQPWTVLTRFEDQVPGCVQRDFGKGRLWILTSGWIPKSSQLALSSKFVPLLVTMLGPVGDLTARDRGTFVSDRIDLSERDVESLTDPNGDVYSVVEQDSFADTDLVGFYSLHDSSGQAWHEAVNLRASESKTDPLDVAQLEQLGVTLNPFQTAGQRSDRQRQMRAVELESNQQMWRWLVALTLAVLAFETYLAGASVSRAPVDQEISP